MLVDTLRRLRSLSCPEGMVVGIGVDARVVATEAYVRVVKYSRHLRGGAVNSPVGQGEQD